MDDERGGLLWHATIRSAAATLTVVKELNCTLAYEFTSEFISRYSPYCPKKCAIVMMPR
jgi:hypothetical protein